MHAIAILVDFSGQAVKTESQFCVRIIWREFISTLRKPANSPRCLLELPIIIFTKLY